VANKAHPADPKNGWMIGRKEKAMKSEAYYDEKIAPRLSQIAMDCNAHGLSFLAVVE
jgi:hypothetical protein